MTSGKKQSPDYMRGYQAGRNARDRTAFARAESARKDALAVAQRAERAEAAAGIGHCDGCAHWTRPDGCSWGFCEASRIPGSPWGCWAQGPRVQIGDHHDQGRISTTPKFGCVMFMAKTGRAHG